MVENPSITTTDIPKAVQYVPYSVMIENNNQDSDNFGYCFWDCHIC